MTFIAWIESPYKHHVLSVNVTLRYASYCMSYVALFEGCNVLCSHLSYGNLPAELFEEDFNNMEIPDKNKSLATSWYPEKKSFWRDYSNIRDRCDLIYIGMDLEQKGVGPSQHFTELMSDCHRCRILYIKDYLIERLEKKKECDQIDQELLKYLKH